jgi:hypothetical protein
MASKLKRVSEPTEAVINELAEREGRTFVAQLDRVVDAGLVALGERKPPESAPAKGKRTRARTATAAG